MATAAHLSRLRCALRSPQLLCKVPPLTQDGGRWRLCGTLPADRLTTRGCRCARLPDACPADCQTRTLLWPLSAISSCCLGRVGSGLHACTGLYLRTINSRSHTARTSKQVSTSLACPGALTHSCQGTVISCLIYYG